MLTSFPLFSLLRHSPAPNSQLPQAGHPKLPLQVLLAETGMSLVVGLVWHVGFLNTSHYTGGIGSTYALANTTRNLLTILLPLILCGDYRKVPNSSEPRAQDSCTAELRRRSGSKRAVWRFCCNRSKTRHLSMANVLCPESHFGHTPCISRVKVWIPSDLHD